MAPGALEPFEVRVGEGVLEDLRARLARTRWPSQPVEEGWELGVDVAYLRELCDYWGAHHDWRAFEARLNDLPNHRWGGLHLIWERSEGEGCL
jgi:Epoxide hydrolase N terminus